MELFRRLSPKEVVEFRQWARDNHKAGGEIIAVWHPVIKEECRKIDREAK